MQRYIFQSHLKDSPAAGSISCVLTQHTPQPWQQHSGRIGWQLLLPFPLTSSRWRTPQCHFLAVPELIWIPCHTRTRLQLCFALHSLKCHPGEWRRSPPCPCTEVLWTFRSCSPACVGAPHLAHRTMAAPRSQVRNRLEEDIFCAVDFFVKNFNGTWD